MSCSSVLQKWQAFLVNSNLAFAEEYGKGLYLPPTAKQGLLLTYMQGLAKVLRLTS